ncbi:MAG: ABC transporter ATP-binding protein, partial [Rhodobacteraceae bacterium]|nr:ABC transporter ATP-binding protein [Paracoccaceae bacterium]
MLQVDHVAVAYGRVRVLFDLSLTARPGTIHCLLGRNGAGKTTTLKAIMGLLRLQSGTIRLDGEEISALAAHDIPRRRISLVPQGRRLFADLTVDENLQIGMMARKAGSQGRDYGLSLFPPLAARLKQIAGTLSGGEQQMLAIARSLCVEPRVLMLDEPTEGLQPSMIDQIHGAIRNLKAAGVAILLVEQRSDAII